MHSLVASVILNMDGVKGQISSKSDFKLSVCHKVMRVKIFAVNKLENASLIVYFCVG